MLISSAAAEALASIILRSTQGEDRVPLQLPWTVEDRGDCWLVKGTPFHDRQRQLRHCQFSIFFRKTSAEVIGLQFDVRCEFDEVKHAAATAALPAGVLEAFLAPPVHFHPDPVNLDLYKAAYGGLINTPEDAIDFAFTLAQGDAAAASFTKSSYEASEISGTWSITCRDRYSPDPINLCSFSRRTGKVTAGVLLH